MTTMNTDNVDIPLALEEPELPVADIQGIIVPGFTKPHETLLGVQFGAGQVTRNIRQFIRKISPEIATAGQTLKDRRDHRQVRRATGMLYPDRAPQAVFVAVAFSFGGLRKLTPGAAMIPSDAFREGLAARSAMLGDPPSGEGSPGKWEVGGAGKELDALFIVAGDSRTDVSTRADDLRKDLEAAGADVIYREDGDIREDLKGHEHFGFDDGVSQPGIRGRASSAAGDFITERYIDPARIPESSLFGYPGQDLIWPGVLLLGHPSTSPDALVPGIPTPAIPEWTRNGSFLVFRRLVQDVGLFWRTTRDLAGNLAQKSGFEKTTDETLAARLVGRWPSGAPVNRVPADDPDLGKCTEANNHFRFDSDAAKLPLRSKFDDTYPMSKADPAGVTCPWAAHIRKVNTRDSSSDLGGREATYARRILRVGIPFGKPLPLEKRYADQNEDNDYKKRGLLFQCVQSSIENQFEFLTTSWINDPSRPKTPSGHDLLLGQNNANGEDRRRECMLFGSGLQQAKIGTSAQWIIPTGGGYFFVPSISALQWVLGS